MENRLKMKNNSYFQGKTVMRNKKRVMRNKKRVGRNKKIITKTVWDERVPVLHYLLLDTTTLLLQKMQQKHAMRRRSASLSHSTL